MTIRKTLITSLDVPIKNRNVQIFSSETVIDFWSNPTRYKAGKLKIKFLAYPKISLYNHIFHKIKYSYCVFDQGFFTGGPKEEETFKKVFSVNYNDY